MEGEMGERALRTMVGRWNRAGQRWDVSPFYRPCCICGGEGRQVEGSTEMQGTTFLSDHEAGSGPVSGKCHMVLLSPASRESVQTWSKSLSHDANVTGLLGLHSGFPRIVWIWYGFQSLLVLCLLLSKMLDPWLRALESCCLPFPHPLLNHQPSLLCSRTHFRQPHNASPLYLSGSISVVSLLSEKPSSLNKLNLLESLFR